MASYTASALERTIVDTYHQLMADKTNIDLTCKYFDLMTLWVNGGGTKCSHCNELLAWDTADGSRDKLIYHYISDGHNIHWKCSPKTPSTHTSALFAAQENTQQLKNQIIALHKERDYHAKQKMLKLTYRWNNGEGERCLSCGRILGCDYEWGFSTHYDPYTESTVYNCASPYTSWTVRAPPALKQNTHEGIESAHLLKNRIRSLLNKLEQNPSNEVVRNEFKSLIEKWNMGGGRYCGGCGGFLECHSSYGFMNHDNTREMGGLYDCGSPSYSW